MNEELRKAWIVTLCAAAILMVTTGVRLTSGLFLSPINTSTALGIASVSLAMAVGQLTWGAAQPLFGAIADRYGPVRVIIGGGILLAVGLVLTTVAHTAMALIVTFGILTAAGAGAASFSTLLGIVSQRVPLSHRAYAAGVLNAGASSGQFLLAPAVQLIIGTAGWMVALHVLAVAALLTLPFAWPMRRSATQAVESAVHVPPEKMWPALSRALTDRNYLFLMAGYCTCGFHLAFLMTHIPVEVGLCGLSTSVAANVIAIVGLFNIVGSIGSGALCARHSMKHLLAIIYCSRAVIVLLYLAAPKSPMTLYMLAAALGITWLATVPPTAGLVSKLFGTRYMATLFGVGMLVHQVGGFFGAWLGGLALEHLGDYTWMWVADAMLALLAAVINLPIRENSPAMASAAAAS